MKSGKNQKFFSLEFVSLILFAPDCFLLILPMMFTEDVANFRLLLWLWSFVTLPVNIMRQTMTIAAAVSSASERCTCNGAAFWAWSWINIMWRRRCWSIVVRVVLLAAAGVTVWSTGRETWKWADWRGRCLVTCWQTTKIAISVFDKFEMDFTTAVQLITILKRKWINTLNSGGYKYIIFLCSVTP